MRREDRSLLEKLLEKLKNVISRPTKSLPFRKPSKDLLIKKNSLISIEPKDNSESDTPVKKDE